MKAINMGIKGLVIPALVAFLAACSTTAEQEPLAEQVAAVEAVQPGNYSSNAPTATTTPVKRNQFARHDIGNPSSPLHQKTIYFAFDQSSIAPKYRNLLSQHAKYLTEYPDVRVRLEGHADERGAREYNIALGERRAKAVAQMMRLRGVGNGQMNTLSYGEELPAATGHNEEAWALNRRVVLVYE